MSGTQLPNKVKYSMPFNKYKIHPYTFLQGPRTSIPSTFCSLIFIYISAKVPRYSTVHAGRKSIGRGHRMIVWSNSNSIARTEPVWLIGINQRSLNLIFSAKFFSSEASWSLQFLPNFNDFIGDLWWILKFDISFLYAPFQDESSSITIF